MEFFHHNFVYDVKRHMFSTPFISHILAGLLVQIDISYNIWGKYFVFKKKYFVSLIYKFPVCWRGEGEVCRVVLDSIAGVQISVKSGG